MIVKPLIHTLVLCLIIGFGSVRAEEETIVGHVDLIIPDAQLSLSGLITQTVEKYPDFALIEALHQESETLHERGSSWVSGAPQISAIYKDDFAGSQLGAYEFDGSVQVPVWNWGQRDAGLQLAEQAKQNAGNQLTLVNLKVAGLVRASLWRIKLEDLRYDMAKKIFAISNQLLNTVQRRVELGDLPRSDFLLAQSELLEKKVNLIHREAEVMHARKAYYFLTQTHKIPANIEETQSTQLSISEQHPALIAVNTKIAKKKAELEWIKSAGSGKTTVSIGGVSERGAILDIPINSISFGVNIPFGGAAFLAPKIAAANRQYIAAEAEKMHLYRALLAQLHEAEHELEVEVIELDISKQLNANAKEHLKMANLSFSAGEINLTDFLRVQTRAHNAIKKAQESGLRLQRNIAFYNQAVGVMP